MSRETKTLAQAFVAWTPPEVMHESHLPTVPIEATRIAAESAPQVDVFDQRRAGIIEMFSSALHPHQLWRDPREQPIQRLYHADNTPLAQTVSQACYWLHDHPDSHEAPAAADALWCVVMQENCTTQAVRVATAIAREYRHRVPRVRRMEWESAELGQVEVAAGIVVFRCMTGITAHDKPDLHPALWRRLQSDGENWMWDWAEDAARRAAKALR